jgi:MFS family permease
MPSKWRLVAMLWCISFFNYADRQAIFSVFPLLERELHLTPVQLGLLGSGFAWVYGLAAPLAGWAVDRWSKRRVVLGGLHVWSVVCMATATSRTFMHLFLFRAAEGLGETFYFPASTALISEHHDARTRSRALGAHQTSVYMGTIGGGFFAALIAQHYGWRLSFIVFGALGVLLGLALSRALPASPVPGLQASLPAPGLQPSLSADQVSNNTGPVTGS